jgi:Domain of unknown function (DUF5753)
VFPERQGWFSTWHSESQSWPEIPATFKSWLDYEDLSTSLRAWTPGIVDGLCQTESYGRALMATAPGIDITTRDARLRGRIERQRRFWERQPSVMTSLVVDEVALYRLVGSADVMATQLHRLLDIAAMPTVTLQVMPAIAHASNNSGFMIADNAAWCEHAIAGYVFTDQQSLSTLALRFDTLRAESYRASESLALIEGLADIWNSGVSPLTQTRPGGSASK